MPTRSRSAGRSEPPVPRWFHETTRTPQSGSSSAGHAHGLVPRPLHSSTVGPSIRLRRRGRWSTPAAGSRRRRGRRGRRPGRRGRPSGRRGRASRRLCPSAWPPGAGRGLCSRQPGEAGPPVNSAVRELRDESSVPAGDPPGRRGTPRPRGARHVVVPARWRRPGRCVEPAAATRRPAHADRDQARTGCVSGATAGPGGDAVSMCCSLGRCRGSTLGAARVAGVNVV